MMKKNKDKLYGLREEDGGVTNFATCDFLNCKSVAVQKLNGVGLCPTHYCNLAPESHAQEMLRTSEKFEKVRNLYEKALTQEREAHRLDLEREKEQSNARYDALLTQFSEWLVQEDPEISNSN